MESRDARLLAQYLWMAYLDTPVTEYQQFLWQKITQHTIEHAGTDLKMMSRYLQYISPEQIDATNINQYLRNQKIISLTEEDYPGFMEELKACVCGRSSSAGKMASSLSAGDPSDGVVLCIRERMDAGISSGIPPLL